MQLSFGANLAAPQGGRGGFNDENGGDSQRVRRRADPAASKQLNVVIAQLDAIKRDQIPNLQKKLETKLNDSIVQMKSMVTTKVKKLNKDVNTLTTNFATLQTDQL